MPPKAPRAPRNERHAPAHSAVATTIGRKAGTARDSTPQEGLASPGCHLGRTAMRAAVPGSSANSSYPSWVNEASSGGLSRSEKALQRGASERAVVQDPPFELGPSVTLPAVSADLEAEANASDGGRHAATRSARSRSYSGRGHGGIVERDRRVATESIRDSALPPNSLRRRRGAARRLGSGQRLDLSPARCDDRRRPSVHRRARRLSRGGRPEQGAE
jgi:hypothetical protein